MMYGYQSGLISAKNYVDNKRSEYDDNIFPLTVDKWEFGTILSYADSPSTSRIRTPYIFVEPGTYQLKYKNNLYTVIIFGYTSGNVGSVLATYPTDDTVIVISSDIVKIRIVAKLIEGSIDSNLHDLSYYVSQMDIVMLKETTKSEKIKVMTHNVGHFYYGTQIGIPSAEVYAKRLEWRKLIAKYNCDILSLNEVDPYIDADSTQLTYEYLYKNSYPCFATGGHSGYIQGFASKYKLLDVVATSFSESGAYGTRYMLKGYINIKGRKICIINVHLTPGDSAAIRATQTQEILATVQNEDYFIIFGDFNAANATEYNAYANAGYNMANCAWFGNLLTAPYTSPNMVYDNIITSPNIKIDNAEVGDYVTSDHLPIIAELTIY